MALLGFALLVLVAAPPAAQGPVDSPPPDREVASVAGEVLSYDVHHLVLLSERGYRVTFRIDLATELPVPLAGGARVRVEFREGASGLEALNVVLLTST